MDAPLIRSRPYSAPAANLRLPPGSSTKAPSSVALALIVEERDRVSNSPRKKSSTRWLVLEPSANGLKKPSTAGLKAVDGLFVPNTSDRSSVAGRLVFRKERKSVV